MNRTNTIRISRVATGMGWMDILKGPRDDNRTMINKVIKYIEEEIDELPNINIMSWGEFVEVDNGDVKELILGLKTEHGELWPTYGETEDDIVRLAVTVPRQINDAEWEEGPPPEILSMMQAIGMPTPRGVPKKDLKWYIRIDFRYEFFSTIKETSDLFEVIDDLKFINKSRNPPKDLR